MRVACLLACLAAPAAAHPHVSPAAWCDVEVTESGVEVLVTARRDVLGPWLGLDLADAPADDAALHAGLVRLFTEANSVAIDGTPRRPAVGAVGMPDDLEDPNKFEYLRAELVFPCAGGPDRVRLLWTTFEGADWQGEEVVPGLVKAGPAVDVIAFSRREPEYTWHARPEVPRLRPEPVAPPPPPPPPFPYLSVAVWTVAAAAALLVGRRRRGAAALVAVAGLVGGALAWPAGPRGPTLPSGEQARRIFETLHRNVYAAFEAETESEIYDLLALSVDPALLESFYLDVYESLILREQGGAVARVEEVEVVDGHVTLPEGADPPLRFDVSWTWRVHCSVTHWGHTHRRINAYEADFVVRHDGRSWKIAQMTVREHERITPD